MLDAHSLTHAQLADIASNVQAILWQESRMLPDDPRQYGDYWNPAKEWEAETVEEIAEVLDAADLKPSDFMPVAVPVPAPEAVAAPSVIDPNEFLWAARILSGLIRVLRNVIPAIRAADFGESHERAACTFGTPHSQRSG